MAVPNLEAVQQLPSSARHAERRPSVIGPINLGTKQTGERRVGNPHAAFDVAGLETRHGRDAVTLADERARQQGTQTSTYTGAPVSDPTYRGASGIVSHGGTVNPSCNRKSRNGNPSPTAERARFLSQWGGSSPLSLGQLALPGGARRFSGRRQPSRGGTSRMMREYQVRNL